LPANVLIVKEGVICAIASAGNIPAIAHLALFFKPHRVKS